MIRSLVVAVMFVLVLGAGAATDDTIVQLAGRLPRQGELIIVIDHGAVLRTTPAGRALGGAWADVSDLAPTRAAWRELAAALDLSDHEAFDALLGRRVVLVVEGLALDEPTRWALLSVISHETQRRLQKRLRPTPRRTIKGAVIQSLEDGRFDLVLARRGGAHLLAGDGAAMLLAPANSRDLFDRLVPVVYGKPLGDPLTSAPEAAMLEHLLPGDALVIVRTRVEDAQEAMMVAVSASVVDDHIDAQVVASPALGERFFGSRARPTSGARPDLEALGERVFFAAWGRLVDPAAMDWPIPMLDSALWPPSDPLVGPLLDDRAVVVVELDTDALEHGTSPIALTMGWHTEDLQRLAGEADASLAELLAAPVPLGRVKQLKAGPDFEGLYPASIRTVALEPRRGLPMPLSLGRSPTISWTFVSERAGDAGGVSVAPGPGWWITDLADRSFERGDGAGAARLRALGGVLADSAGALDARRRLNTGLIRPALLHELLIRRDGQVAGPLAPLEALRWVDLAQWDLWVDQGGTVRGDLRIQLRTRE